MVRLEKDECGDINVVYTADLETVLHLLASMQDMTARLLATENMMRAYDDCAALFFCNEIREAIDDMVISSQRNMEI